MASDHVMALSHIVVAGAGLVTVTILSTYLARSQKRKVRFDDTPRRRQPARMFLRLARHIMHGVVLLVARVGLAVVAPIGVLYANRRYPLVAPALAPFEEQLAALGHRTGHVRCFPLLARRVWLVRCAGCQHRGFFMEVPSLDGTAVDLKVMGTSSWRSRPCTAEYLTARPARTAEAIPPVQAVRPVRQRMAPVPAARADQGHAGVADKTA